MNRWMTQAKILVLSLFIVASAGAAYYDWAYIWPVKRCDERGAWWDGQDRQCLTPIPIWRITGRGLTPPPTSPSVAPPAPVQRVAAGTQSTSPAPSALANLAATNKRSDNRLR